MKKTIFALILLISIPSILINAQGRPRHSPEDQEKFRSMKIAFFTEKLEFTPEEAEKFWPVYNDYEKKKSDLHGERRSSFRSFSSETQSISDKQAREMVEKHIELQKRDLQIEIDFYTKIKAFLPPKKIMKVYITEVNFREYMLRQLRGGKGVQGEKRPEKHP